LTLKTGARALTRVFQDCLRDLEYQLPELAETGVYQITINETTIERGQPVLLYDAQKENNK
jgi:ATP-dependent protease Clp ATPase subunit